MLTVLLTGSVLAEIPQQISKFIDAWNANSYALAKQVISPAYTVKGVPQDYVSQVLEQVFSTHGTKIEIVKYLGEEKHYFGTLHRVLARQNENEREITFVIDKKGDIYESNIFQVETRRDRIEQNEALAQHISFDFELYERMILIEGELDGEKVQFILDSGAPIFVLNSHFDQTDNRMTLGLATGVGGSVSSMDAKLIGHLSWPGGEYRDTELMSMDLSELEKELGKPFAGLISYQELEPCEVFVDYSQRKIHLYALDESGEVVGGGKMPKPKQQMPFKLEGHIPVLPCRIGDMELRLGLDTGAQSNLLDLSHFEKLGKLISGVETDTLMGADSRMIETKSAEIKATKVSGKKYGKMRYAFSNFGHIRDAYRLSAEGLLGYPFLSQKPFSINYRKKVLKIY